MSVLKSYSATTSAGTLRAISFFIFLPMAIPVWVHLFQLFFDNKFDIPVVHKSLYFGWFILGLIR